MSKSKEEYYKKAMHNKKIDSNLWRSPEGRSIMSMKSIFEYNYFHLKKFFEYIQQPQVIIDMNHDPFYSEKINNSLMMHMYNFFISAKSFIEHIEKYTRKKKTTDKEYISRYNKILRTINQFNSSDFVHFIRDFRNYIIHEGLPSFRPKTQINVLQEEKSLKMANIFYIDIDLLKDNNAFKCGKKYLTTVSGQKINLIELSDKIYTEFIKIFNSFDEEMIKNQIDQASKIGFYLDKEGKKIE